MTFHLSLEKTDFSSQSEQEIESCLSIGNGYIGTRNSLEEGYRLSNPATYISGFYETLEEHSYNQLVKLPDWTRLQVYIEGEMIDLTSCIRSKTKRYIDLDDNTSVREWVCEDNTGRITSIKMTKFISFKNKNLCFKSIVVTPVNYNGKIKVASGIDGRISSNINFQCKKDEKINGLLAVTKAINSSKFVNIHQISEFRQCKCNSIEADYYKEYFDKNANECSEWVGEKGVAYNLDYKTIYFLNDEKVEFDDTKVDYDQHYQVHKEEWQKYWNQSSIKFCKDDDAQYWYNFALYHLLISGKFSGETKSIPARNLTGDSYNGHIFWDTEMYLLPFFIHNHPEIAKNLLLYRYHTLSGAKKNAEREGFEGANYAWESTDSGLEMTPEQVLAIDGRIIDIPSALYEYHISFDIAYIIWRYFVATLDLDFLLNYGLEIILETAKFTTSLAQLHKDNLYHINKVVGPDEYHPFVDDNAFTNIMAKNNLILALKCGKFLKKNHATLLKSVCEKVGVNEIDFELWKDVARNFYTNKDEKTKIFEQFEGYFDLDFINVKNYEPRIVPMDVILGSDYIQKTQVIKQPDVLMFLHLLYYRFDKQTHLNNFSYYEKRNSHGSSLSPSIHCILASRLNKKDLAYEYFKKNALVDIENTMGSTATGVHIAAIGGVWSSIISGFAGITPLKNGLIVNPYLPLQWNNIDVKYKYQQSKIDFLVSNSFMEIYIHGNHPINVKMGKCGWKKLSPNTKYVAKKVRNWYWV